MAREVIHTADEPYKIDEVGFVNWNQDIAICQCVLSSNVPHCDGSHRAVADEEDGVVYKYDKDG